MAKRGRGGGGYTKKSPKTPAKPHRPVSLREETTGKTRAKGGGGSRNPKSLLKLEHLRNLAAWAANDASIPSLGAFFGSQAAAFAEAFGVLPDPSVFHCKRCGTILEPGFNCTVRIEKNQVRTRHRHKKTTQNNVIYNCHFCSHRNQKRGTPRGHMKEICPSKIKPSIKAQPSRSMLQKCVMMDKVTSSNKDEFIKMDTEDLCTVTTSGDTSITDSPATPLAKSGTTLLDAKKRKRNRSASKRLEQPESNSITVDTERAVSTSSKRKRKSWTTLKEIVEGHERDSSSQNITNLSIPLIL